MLRLATKYALHRTDSGRISSGVSSSDEEKTGRRVQQVQNIPRALRDIVAAPPGFSMIQGDWAGIEWAIMLWYAAKYIDQPRGFHRELLERFRRDEFDPHCWLAAVAFTVPYHELYAAHKAGVSRRERKLAKPYTHGRMYYGAPLTLAKQAGHDAKIGGIVCEAHERAFKVSTLQTYLIEMTRKQRYADTVLGYRRWFWDADPKPTEILAHYGQGTAADLCKTTLRVFAEEFAKKDREHWQLLTTTHDSFLAMVPTDAVPSALNVMRNTMERPIPWLDGLTWRADFRVGDSWRAVS